MNILNTAKKQDDVLIIKERDKYLAVRHLDSMLKQTGCKDILIKSTQHGVAYAQVQTGQELTYPIKASPQRPTPPTGDWDIYKITYGRGTLGSMKENYVLINHEHITDIKKLGGNL